MQGGVEGEVEYSSFLSMTFLVSFFVGFKKGKDVNIVYENIVHRKV